MSDRISTNLPRFWIVSCPACEASTGQHCVTRTGAKARRSHDARILLADDFRQRTQGRCIGEVSPEVPLFCDLGDAHESALHFDKTAGLWWQLGEAVDA